MSAAKPSAQLHPQLLPMHAVAAGPADAAPPPSSLQIHTPDSSRYWLAGTYAARLAAGQEPQNIDKEFLRLWFRERCDPYKDKVCCCCLQRGYIGQHVYVCVWLGGGGADIWQGWGDGWL
jgi:hypothetical protein